MKTPNFTENCMCGGKGQFRGRHLGVDMVHCDSCWAVLSEDIALIDKCPENMQPWAHSVASRVGEMGMNHQQVLRVLRAIVRLSHREEFACEFPEWCWDNFEPFTGSYVAFGGDDLFAKAKAERTHDVAPHYRRGRKVVGHKRCFAQSVEQMSAKLRAKGNA